MKISKSQRKKIVKTIIEEEIEKTWNEKRTRMTKLRHLKGKYEERGYFKEVGIEEASVLLRVDIGKNQWKDRWCTGCDRVKESTEHIMQCRETHEIVGV